MQFIYDPIVEELLTNGTWAYASKILEILRERPLMTHERLLIYTPNNKLMA